MKQQLAVAMATTAPAATVQLEHEQRVRQQQLPAVRDGRRSELHLQGYRQVLQTYLLNFSFA